MLLDALIGAIVAAIIVIYLTYTDKNNFKS